jgi:hypothetical protein
MATAAHMLLSLAHREGGHVTDEERQTAEHLIAQLEIAIGEIAPRTGANAGLIAEMIQSLNGLRSVLGMTKAVH